MVHDHTKITWILYDYFVNREDRKKTIRRLINAGITPRDAIQEIRDIEREEHIYNDVWKDAETPFAKNH